MPVQHDPSTMPAGRELNALVAEKVMGWKWNDKQEWWCAPNERNFMEHEMEFSTSIAAAWEVVEKIVRPGVDVQMGNELYQGDWWCRFERETGELLGFSIAETMPLAICRAALQAVAALAAVKGADHE